MHKESLQCLIVRFQYAYNGCLNYFNKKLTVNFWIINRSPCLHWHVCILILSYAEQRISGWKAFVLRTKDFPESQKGTFTFSDTEPNTWWQAAEIVRSVSVQQSVAFTVNTSKHRLRTLDFLQNPHRFTHKLSCSRLCQNKGRRTVERHDVWLPVSATPRAAL